MNQPAAPSPSLIFDTLNAYQRTEALRAGIALDLFSQIARGANTPEPLGAACHASPRGIRILCDYLTIIGFLRKSGDRYELTDDSRLFLVRESPAYLGGMVTFMLAEGVRDSYDLLTEAVRKGGTAHTEEGSVSHDNPIWVDFARAMGAMMRMPAQLLANLIASDSTTAERADKTQPLRVLDVAAGHGLFGIAVANQFKNAHITALDWPNVLAVAQENANQAGLSGRYALLPGSAFDVPWGGPYDLVLLTNFLHHFDLPTCAMIARRAYESLAPGGRAITLEFIPSSDRVSPPTSASFALTMLATTAKGDAYTFAEYNELFTSSGFARNEFHPLLPTMQQVVISYKG